MLLRFFRFNVVGAMGVAVQLATLTLLVSGLGVHYLPATAIAIELAVLHNFLWHERWTWRERMHKAQGQMHHAQRTIRDAGRLRRLVAFHAGNGLVSMLGSLVLMPVFVAGLGLHYVVGNLGTIGATGLFNFLLGDRVIFTADGSAGQRAAGMASVVHPTARHAATPGLRRRGPLEGHHDQPDVPTAAGQPRAAG